MLLFTKYTKNEYMYILSLIHISLLGTDLTKEQMLEYLGRVELTLDPETNEIVAPTFRQDIHCMADVAEEVARFFGYDKIPTTLPTCLLYTSLPAKKARIGHRHPNTIALEEVERIFIGMGYEVVEGPEVEYADYNFTKLNIPMCIRDRP